MIKRAVKRYEKKLFQYQNPASQRPKQPEVSDRYKLYEDQNRRESTKRVASYALNQYMKFS